MKRLFLFASYDSQGIIDNSLLYYLTQLSMLGDIVFVMDNNASADELHKVAQIPNVLHYVATRHGEYDFGSYKRAYLWAKGQGILPNYDWVYLVNDSVYGPLNPLQPLLENLESNGADLTGMTEYSDKYTPTHIQSWFVGLSNKIIATDLFDTFMSDIIKEKNKAHIITKYEVGMSRRLLRAGFKMFALMYNSIDSVHIVYDMPVMAMNMGIPFVKKRAISNMEGIYNLYPHVDNVSFVDDIVSNMKRNNISMPATDFNEKKRKYRKKFRLTIFGCPLVTIYRKKRFVEYKICLFDCIPIMKVNLHKKDE